MYQRPLNVEVEKVGKDNLAVVRISYPGGVQRFGLRRYVSEQHYVVMGPVRRRIEDILARIEGNVVT